ncbi:MAG: Do family serine endopeptidase [Opitutales bacterium]
MQDKLKRSVCLTVFCLAFAWTGSAAGAELDLQIDTSPVGTAKGKPVRSYADVLERATPSVVAVYTARLVRERRNAGQVPELFRYFGLPVPPDVVEPDEPREQLQQLGAGSGVIISTDGYIITNHHVVRAGRDRLADEIRVLLGDGQEYEATVVGSDPKTDVAVLKVEPESPLPALTLADSEQLRVGDVVFAIGNPLDVGLTATQGIVSATGRSQGGRILGPGSYENFIQTDAAINLGNSGGALIDARGRLVGINTAIVSRTGGSIGIGFAIPVNMVLNVAENLIETGEVRRGMLGLFPTDLTRDLAVAFGLESTQGALVNQVQPDSPAERAGIQHGDVILAVEDVEIDSAQKLRLTVSQMPPGEEVTVRLIRRGKTLEIPVSLGSLDGSPVGGTQGSGNKVMGAELRELNDALREQLSIPERISSGVVVNAVDEAGALFGKIEPGMVILEVNGEPVSRPGEVEKLLRDERSNRLYVWYEGRMGFIVLKL